MRENLFKATYQGIDVLEEHRSIFESTLTGIHKQFSKLLKQWPISFLIVVAPRALDKVPSFYWTDGPALIPEAFYYAVGSGKPVADYLADRLYEFGKLDKRSLVAVAAFILREASESSPGAGMGANMVFIHEAEKVMHFIPPGAVKLIQEGIPSLSEAINSYWPEHVSFPEWMGS